MFEKKKTEVKWLFSFISFVFTLFTFRVLGANINVKTFSHVYRNFLRVEQFYTISKNHYVMFRILRKIHIFRIRENNEKPTYYYGLHATSYVSHIFKKLLCWLKLYTAGYLYIRSVLNKIFYFENIHLFYFLLPINLH